MNLVLFFTGILMFVLAFFMKKIFPPLVLCAIPLCLVGFILIIVGATKSKFTNIQQKQDDEKK